MGRLSMVRLKTNACALSVWWTPSKVRTDYRNQAAIVPPALGSVTHSCDGSAVGEPARPQNRPPDPKMSRTEH